MLIYVYQIDLTSYKFSDLIIHVVQNVFTKNTILQIFLIEHIVMQRTLTH